MADNSDAFNQHLCKIFSSRYTGVNKLEISPFLAVMRTLKIEYGTDQPEVYKMLLAVLHDYNPSLGKAHVDMTSRYISLLLEKHPIYAEYIISVLPKSPGSQTDGPPHSLHLLRDDVRPAQEQTVFGQGDVPVSRDAPASKPQSDQNMPNPAAKKFRPKDASPKFYNYTPPSVNAYVASQGIPQKIVSNKPPTAGFSTLVTLSTATLLASSVLAKSSSVAHTPAYALAAGQKGTNQGKIIAGPLTAGTVFIRPPGRTQSAELSKSASSTVVASHGQTALLLSSSSCPTLLAPVRTYLQPVSRIQIKRSSSSKNLYAVSNQVGKGVTCSGSATSSSMTVSISRSSSMKLNTPTVERNANSFPYSQKIVVNPSSKMTPPAVGVQPMVQKQDLSNDKPTSKTTTGQVNSGAASFFKLPRAASWQESTPVQTEESSTQHINPEPDSTVSEGAQNNQPLDLSTKSHGSDIFCSMQESMNQQKRMDDKPLEDDEKYSSELGSQEDCSSQSTDGRETSQPTTTTTTTDEVSSDEGNNTPKGWSYLDRILKLPSPPNYSPVLGPARQKDKRKAKSKQCSNKKKPTTHSKN